MKNVSNWNRSIQVNHSVLRSRGLERINRNSMLKVHYVAKPHHKMSAVEQYHFEKRMNLAAERGRRKAIVGYMICTVLTTLTFLLTYACLA